MEVVPPAKKVRLNQAVNPPTTDSAEQHTHVEDNKVLFLYFGTVFVHFELSNIKMKRRITWMDKILFHNGDWFTLQQLCLQQKKYISLDLERLRISEIIKSTYISDNSFVLIGNSTSYNSIYVYQFKKEHNTFSGTNFSMISQCCDEVTEEEMPVPRRCDIHSSHDALLPYFIGNKFLKSELTSLLEECTGDERRAETLREMLTDLNSEDPSDQFTSLTDSSRGYDEDTWTKRIFYSLKKEFPDFYGKFTAPLRGTATREVIMKSVPSSVPIESFLFHGAPDFIVKRRPVQASIGAEGQHSDSSGDEGRAEVGFQLPPLKTYQRNSYIPEKMGELIAAVHQYIAARTIRRILKGKAVETVEGHGLFIDKQSGTLQVQLSLLPPAIGGSESMKVTVKVYTDGILTEDKLCISFRHFMESLH